MTSAAPLVLHEVEKRYGRRRVLERIGLQLNKGEMFGLIGVNGAGKTTLIKIILDLVKADAGRAELFGRPSFYVDARQHIAYLPEKFQPSRSLKGMEYLDLSMSYYGRALDRERARKLAEALDLNPDVLESRVGHYSKGMGQKLGLLGALMLDVPLLILDEPMSGLDPSARIHLKAMLLEARRQGRTIFFSSHILSDIDEICDRIGVIHGGKLSFTGTPESFKEAQAEPSLEKAFLKLIQAKTAAC